MNLSLSEHISSLRKANSMTQEQLAEALGVSCAAVSKWERGAATPDLNLIAEMADLFSVSVDALIGFQFRSPDKASVLKRLKDACHDRNAKDILPDAQKALKRYPNSFDIVYYSAVNYRVQGLCQNKTAYSRQALTLYRHACRLINQNTDPEISEISLWKAMAEIYITLEEPEQGLSILKEKNPCRLNHPLIGQTLASVCNDPKGAAPYLSMALLDLTVSHMQIVIGYLNIYVNRKDYSNAAALLYWALDFYPGLKRPGKISYLDKSEAILLTLLAFVHLKMQKTELAASCLNRAKTLAETFDRSPDYHAATIRFISDDVSASSMDDLGETALEALEKTMADINDTELTALWRRILHEN